MQNVSDCLCASLEHLLRARAQSTVPCSTYLQQDSRPPRVHTRTAALENAASAPHHVYSILAQPHHVYVIQVQTPPASVRPPWPRASRLPRDGHLQPPSPLLPRLHLALEQCPAPPSLDPLSLERASGNWTHALHLALHADTRARAA